MILIDIILPLAVEGVYTYKLPNDCLVNPQIGMRVLVPLGKKKIYTGIIYRLHADNPQQLSGKEIEYKDIFCFLDDYPIVSSLQIQLWEWLACYYMCTLGEVMKAALPSALKLESETRVTKNPLFVAESRLPRVASAILDLLQDGKPMDLSDIAKALNIRSALPAVHALMDMGAVVIEENVANKYKPQTKHFISLGDTFPCIELGLTNSPAETTYLPWETPAEASPISNKQDRKSVKLSSKQEQLLQVFLSLETSETAADAPFKIERSKLLNAAGVTQVVLDGLLKKGVLRDEVLEVARLQATATPQRVAFSLNDEQLRALSEIKQKWQQTPTVLLHGVTSSGKTEVYIHLIQDAIKRGKQVLYLVPEIALTTQLTERLMRVFGNRLGVYHSKFSDQERVEIYRNVLLGNKYDVVIGVRSSLFLPFQNLGLIIVDEEHDASYKQQDPAPRYHARSAAIVLASFFRANVLLGTATPAVETYYNAQNGKYGLVEMKQRFAGLSLPAIHLLDLKRQYQRKEMDGHFADPVVVRMREQLEAGKQIIVFQNRRGYNNYLECGACGGVPKCVNCDVSLTEHRKTNTLVCHYCGYTINTPTVCPTCKEGKLSDRGFGTEMIEEELQRIFPQARIGRMDLDTTRGKNAHQQIIDAFAAHEIDILIGTQMVTKGLHFNDVSLVTVLKGDALLNQPDFRAYERAYQMLEQVSGRAGRSGEMGHVIIQTSDYDNPLFTYVQQHDYEAMYQTQLTERELFHYPPFHRVISLTIRHRELQRLDTASRTLETRLQQVFGTRCSSLIVPAIARVQNLYVRQLMLKIESTASYAKAKELLLAVINDVKNIPQCKGTLFSIDVDPM